MNYAAFAVCAAVLIYVSSRSGHSHFKTEKLHRQDVTHYSFKKDIIFLYINDMKIKRNYTLKSQNSSVLVCNLKHQQEFVVPESLPIVH